MPLPWLESLCRLHQEEKRRKRKSLCLRSGADQGPWSSAASASSVIRQRWPTPTRRSSRATGKTLGENYLEDREKTRGRGESFTLGALASLYEKAKDVKWEDVADRDYLLPLRVGSRSIAGFAGMLLKGGAPARRGGAPGAPEVESHAERVSLPDRKCPSCPGFSGALAPAACVL